MTNVNRIKRELIDIFNLHGIYHYELSVKEDDAVTLRYRYVRPVVETTSDKVKTLTVTGMPSSESGKPLYVLCYDGISRLCTSNRASLRYTIDSYLKHPEHYEPRGEHYYDDVYTPDWL